MRSEQYIQNINAAPTCFGAVNAPSSRSSEFLMKYVYAASWVPRIVKMAVESRKSSQLKIPSVIQLKITALLKHWISDCAC
jgi:hypothetical protein